MKLSFEPRKVKATSKMLEAMNEKAMEQQRVFAKENNWETVQDGTAFGSGKDQVMSNGKWVDIKNALIPGKKLQKNDEEIRLD